MNPFQDYFIDTFSQRYAEFSGRATRSEYWYFHLFMYLIIIGSVLIPFLSILTIIAYLVFLIPSLALTVRRLHDTGNSGWLILIRAIPVVGSLILLVFMCMESHPYENQYGPNPFLDESNVRHRQFDDIIDRF